jgi:cytochrome c553
MLRRTLLALFLTLSVFVLAWGTPRPKAPPPAVKRFVANYCLECHSRNDPSGEVDFSKLSRVSAKTWDLALRKIRAGAMPPSDEPVPRPKPGEVAALASWVQTLVKSAPPAERPALRRLNRAEYNNTVRDLLGVYSRPADSFPDDDVANGFDTSSAALSLPPPLFERYLQAAEAVAAEAVLVFRPLRQRTAAATLATKGRVGRFRDGFRKASTNGSFTATVVAPYSGEYTVRARCCADQAGPDNVRLALLIDSNRTELREFKGEQDQTISFKVRLERGRRRVELAFINDYWEPKARDPGQRDRNFALAWLEVEGPLKAPALPKAHRWLLGGEKRLTYERMKPVVQRLASRAYRRPVRASELARLLKLVGKARAEKRPPERALQLALTAILVSPGFLFRAELDAGPAGSASSDSSSSGTRSAPVDEHQLASRLSYFLWASLPDAALRAAADAKTLRRDLTQHVRRMLDDPKSSALVTQFAGQWLQLRRLREAAPDPRRYPAFDEALRAAMLDETELFVDALLRENRRVRDLLEARFSFVNERLAKHYGIKGVRGARFRRVALPPERAGILTHASVLTLTSNPTRTSPVRRGKWVLDALLDDAPPPPPPNVDSLSESVKGRKELSERQRLDLHRQRKSCNACHQRLDPLGFALERFDGVGTRRSDASLVDASGVLPGGERINDASGLRKALSKQIPRVTTALGRRFLVYALGRPLAPRERDEIERLVARLGANVRFQDLIAALVTTRPFQRRISAEGS